jgi:hypothetical protein
MQISDVLQQTPPAPLSAGGSRRKVGYFWFFGAILASALGLLTPNPALTATALACIPAIVYLTLRRGEPPALTFACIMQWIQASAAILYTNWYGISLSAAYGGPELEYATWLSLAGVIALAVGIRIAMVGVSDSVETELRNAAISLDPTRIFFGYAVGFIVSAFLVASASKIPAVTQFLYAIATIKFLFVFLLAASVIEQRQQYSLLFVAFGAEIAIGLIGFFSGFKSVFFVVGIAALISPVAFRGKRLALIIIVVLGTAFLGTLWTAIKGDYRDFLNQGFASQEVIAPLGERFGKLQDLVADFRTSDMPDAFEALVLRMSYVQYFAHTMSHVPSSVPYENGALWFGALKHVVTPRLLFPNKPIIDDSERASLYTGLQVAGVEQGTSIGIGYFAESYVDFGPVGMLVPICLLGVSYGFLYRFFVIRVRHKLLGSAIVTAILVLGGSAVETSNAKIVGSNVTLLLIFSILYFFFSDVLMRWLSRADQA